MITIRAEYGEPMNADKAATVVRCGGHVTVADDGAEATVRGDLSWQDLTVSRVTVNWSSPGGVDAEHAARAAGVLAQAAYVARRAGEEKFPFAGIPGWVAAQLAEQMADPGFSPDYARIRAARALASGLFDWAGAWWQAIRDLKEGK